MEGWWSDGESGGTFTVKEPTEDVGGGARVRSTPCEGVGREGNRTVSREK